MGHKKASEWENWTRDNGKRYFESRGYYMGFKIKGNLLGNQSYQGC